jgi:hypothetical protein
MVAATLESEMITETQIIEAAKECGFNSFNYMGANTELLTRFALHFYRQGLIDAAEKCKDNAPWTDRYSDNAEYTEKRACLECAEAIRQMAEEIK